MNKQYSSRTLSLKKRRKGLQKTQMASQKVIIAFQEEDEEEKNLVELKIFQRHWKHIACYHFC